MAKKVSDFMEPYIHAAVEMSCCDFPTHEQQTLTFPVQHRDCRREASLQYLLYKAHTHAAYRMGRNASWRLGACQQWRRPSKSISFHLSLAPLLWHINNASVGGVWRCSLSLSGEALRLPERTLLSPLHRSRLITHFNELHY